MNKMRSNDTSGIPLLLCVSICTLMILLSVSGTAYAKRGCSAFGHSCFGGHGKRFDPHLRDNALRESQATVSDKNQELGAMRLNSEFVLSERKFGEQEDVVPPQTRRQGSSTYDPYTLSFIVGQWLSSHRRLHQPDLELNNK